MPVYIAGKGIISAIGNNLAENISSLQAGRSGIGNATILTTRHSLPVAEVKMDNAELGHWAGLRADLPRAALLSMIAAREAVTDSGIDVNQWRTAFISANTIGGMDLTENFMKDFLADEQAGDLHQIIHHDSGAISRLVADELQINSYVNTISTACSSSANALMYAARLIENNKVDIAIAGGTDALLRFTLNGFSALMILDNEPCTPFDKDRKGLNLGEGAGYVVLVSEKVAQTLSRKPTVMLIGYANANDAYHQTASSENGEGNYLAMHSALALSGLEAKDIDYINLHGTGTANNDLSEGRAIERLFAKVPMASSTKAYTGHTLGASGVIEAIFSIAAIDEGLVYPNLRFKKQMKELNFSPVSTLLEGQNVRHVLSNSFGFGGNCSSLIFSKVND